MKNVFFVLTALAVTVVGCATTESPSPTPEASVTDASTADVVSDVVVSDSGDAGVADSAVVDAAGQ